MLLIRYLNNASTPILYLIQQNAFKILAKVNDSLTLIKTYKINIAITNCCYNLSNVNIEYMGQNTKINKPHVFY